MIRRMVDDSFAWFVDLVADRRKLPREDVLRLADGSIYTGRQALQAKLVDKLDDDVKYKFAFPRPDLAPGHDVTAVEMSGTTEMDSERNIVAWDDICLQPGEQRVFKIKVRAECDPNRRLENKACAFHPWLADRKVCDETETRVERGNPML